MKLEELHVRRTNITVVFDHLELSAISRDRLRELLPGEPAPILADVPDDMISVVYPGLQIAGTFGNRRISFDDMREREIGTSPLPALTLAAAHLIQAPRVRAFGFNYDITASIENVDDVGVFFIDRLLKRPNQIEARVGGTLRGLSMRLNYEREGVRYTLRIEPLEVGAPTLVSHFNAHFAQNELPRLKALSEMFSLEFKGMVDVLMRL